MPANLPPQYHAAEERLRTARTTEEKTVILQELIALVPKHKGTEKLQSELKRRLAKLREQPAASGPHRGRGHEVKREGAGQLYLVGPPNSGKSALLRALTRSEPEVADYPFTTRQPLPGMAAFADVPIQLVDLPPLSSTHMESWVPQLARNGDGLLLVASLRFDETLDLLDDVLQVLADAKIAPVAPHSNPDPPADRGIVQQPTLLVATASDVPDADVRFALLSELYAARWPCLAVSLHDPASLDRLRRALFDLLGILRVYSKLPGKPADRSKPFILPLGSTLADFARLIHKDFVERLQFARVWGAGRFDGQRVNRDYALVDEDVLELHL